MAACDSSLENITVNLRNKKRGNVRFPSWEGRRCVSALISITQKHTPATAHSSAPPLKREF